MQVIRYIDSQTLGDTIAWGDRGGKGERKRGGRGEGVWREWKGRGRGGRVERVFTGVSYV